MLNQSNSFACWPLNFALTCEPVRSNPGETVVTRIPSRASSTPNASDNPTSANLLALYGARWGTATRPPMEAMLTIRAALLRRRNGSDSQIRWKLPQKCRFMASAKSDTSWFCNGPTWIVPALLMRTSTPPKCAAARAMAALIWSGCARSQGTVRTSADAPCRR